MLTKDDYFRDVDIPLNKHDLGGVVKYTAYLNFTTKDLSKLLKEQEIETITKCDFKLWIRSMNWSLWVGPDFITEEEVRKEIDTFLRKAFSSNHIHYRSLPLIEHDIVKDILLDEAEMSEEEIKTWKQYVFEFEADFNKIKEFIQQQWELWDKENINGNN